jgi:CRP-like cAMP-binding protein
MVRKLRRGEKWTRVELGLAIYGAASIATSLLFIAVSLALWESRVSIAARELLGFGAAGVVVLLAIVIVFIGPLLLQVAMRAVGTARTVMSLRAARLRKAKLASVAERAHMLGRVRFLAGLAPAALYAIASHLEVERVEAGHNVVTIGEPGDRFYLVRSGRLEVIGADGAVIGSLVPGEAFGELALLDRRPRNATVRVLEACELWTLDRGHFERWVRERFEVAARIRASAEERAQLASLPFFRGLQPAELDPIAARLVTQRVEAGEAVCVEGEPGDRYYLVRDGEADVTIGGTHIRVLGPGDGFGELALLFGGPRSATVTAKTDMTLAALTRSDFGRLVRASGEKVGEFRARTAHYVGAAGLGSAVRGA